ncbi:TetR/AcrR family transcriptional regulator [Actinosynnema sp. CA-248983]
MTDEPERSASARSVSARSVSARSVSARSVSARSVSARSVSARSVSARSRPRRADAERNIDAIVTAALECFTERPDTSMTAVAHAAGVGRVTLYTHFPTREDVLAAALDLAVADAERALTDADDGPADEALASVIRSSWSVLGRDRAGTDPADRRRAAHGRSPSA